MPSASATAPAMVAEGNPAATAPKATPTANPSGILCKVIAMTSKMLRRQLVGKPSASSIPRCKWGKMWSTSKRNAPPNRKPDTAGTQAGNGPLFGHLDGGRQQGPETCSDHHAGRKTQHGVEYTAVDRAKEKHQAGAESGYPPGKEGGEKSLYHRMKTT